MGAPVHGHVGQLQPDHRLIGLQGRHRQLLEEPGGDPFVPAPAHRGGRAAGVGEPLVAAAEDQGLDELVEDHRIGDPGTVTAQRMGHLPRGQQRQKLLAQRIDEAGWDRRHEGLPDHRA